MAIFPGSLASNPLISFSIYFHAVHSLGRDFTDSGNQTCIVQKKRKAYKTQN